MTLREHQSGRAKYVNFANGFPCKEMVPTEEPSPTVNLRGGFFVGLHDNATSYLTKTQKIVPPLAKRRANSLAFKPRASSSRYKNKKDPFSAHKGTEKLGFSPQAIKHNKPKKERNSTRTEPSSSNSTFIDKKLGTTRLCRPTEPVIPSASESDAVDKPAENFSKNLILSDVEKQKTLNELIGIDEVYQRVCNGNMTSLSSLITPVKSKKKTKQGHIGTQYIQTSAPVYLKQKPSCRSPPIVSLNNDPYNMQGSGIQSTRQKMSKKRHSVLVPLPYFPNPKPPNTAPARLRETYKYPKIYTSRLEKPRTNGVVSSLSGWSSPSIINFNPVVDLPDVKRPVSRACAPTGSIIGVQNKSHTGKVAIVAALDTTLTPPATAESEPFQQGFIEDDKNGEFNTILKSPDEDSLYSEERADTSNKMNEINKNIEHQQLEPLTNGTGISPLDKSVDVDKSVIKEKTKNEFDNSLATMFSVTLNLTDESGEMNEVEIYDPNSRDLEKEEKVNKDIEEAQQNYQKKKHELESLLDEHNNLVQEINQLTHEEQD